jgi:autophagy-related protein 11
MTDISTDTIAATPPIRPSQLATSYLRTAHWHHDHITQTLTSLHAQHSAVRIASSSLDLNVLAIADVFEGIAGAARLELEKQAGLLAGLEADLEIISRVKIHIEFMSPAVRKAVEAGEKARTLGDYVSNVKMKQVADTCARTHSERDVVPYGCFSDINYLAELREGFRETEETLTRLTEGSDGVRTAVSDTQYVFYLSRSIHLILIRP